MNIAVDYRLAANPRSGMGKYLIELCSRLTRLDADNRYIFLGRSFPSFAGLKLPEKFLYLFFELIWVNFYLPALFLFRLIDLAYFPNPPSPLICAVPYILTVPDLSFWYDRSLPRLVKAYLYIQYWLSVRSARTVTTFSANSARDIHRLLGLNLDKILIVPPGVDDFFNLPQALATSKSTLTDLGINAPYILAVPGTFIPRKNMSDLLQAYARLSPSLRRRVPLVLVGNNHDRYFFSFQKQVAGLGLVDRVKCPGQVPQSVLKALYTRASVFVCPSLYEGFGLPPLEAMVCGAPVISYANSSLTEIIAGHGTLVADITGLSRALQTCLARTQRPLTQIRQAKNFASGYTWNVSVQKFIQLIHV